MRQGKLCLLVWVLYSSLWMGGCVGWYYRQKSLDHYVTALSLESTDLSEDAIYELEEAVRLHYDFSLAHSRLGDLYRVGGQYEEAAGAYESACELDPWSFRDHFYLGDVYKGLENFQKAIMAFHRACQLDPEHVQAHYQLGLCYFETKEYDQAAAYCQRAADLDPGNEVMLNSLGSIYANVGDDYRAIQSYKQALELDPDQPVIMARLGMVYIRMERYEPAELILKKALEQNENYTPAYISLGYCMLKQNQLPNALERYRQALAIDPDNYEACNGCGVSCILLYRQALGGAERAREAMEYWHRSLEIRPDQPKIHELLEKYGREIESHGEENE